ncbi:hypothetical protein ACLOJK_032449 [Asimina triloba]
MASGRSNVFRPMNSDRNTPYFDPCAMEKCVTRNIRERSFQIMDRIFCQINRPTPRRLFKMMIRNPPRRIGFQMGQGITIDETVQAHREGIVTSFLCHNHDGLSLSPVHYTFV